MNGRHKKLSEVVFRSGKKAILAGVVLGALATPPPSVSQSPADAGTQLTLEQFHALLLKQQPPPTSKKSPPAPPPDLRAADRVFAQLLMAQAKVAAARQSVDRLSGWSQAIQARFQAQSAPALDVEMIRFAEAKAAAESAQWEAERRSAAEQANSLLGRPAASPLVGVLPAPPLPSQGAAGSAARAPETPGSSSEPAPLEKLEKELLPQGQDLLVKLYQGYQFGGIPLSSLLWHEQQVYQTELQYRLWMARAAMNSSAAAQEP